MKTVTPDSVEAEARGLISEVLEAFRGSGSYPRGSASRLIELATSADPLVSEPATRAFFTSLVEPLADSFHPAGVSLYNRLFSQLIEQSRNAIPDLDRELRSAGLESEARILSRAESLRRSERLRMSFEEKRRITRVIVLSRVTLGADVAITSRVIDRAKREFPAAEIILVGGSKASELFGGDTRMRFEEIAYQRAGTTVERLLTWIKLRDLAGRLSNEAGPGRSIIFDPDTRLTQLGLLPAGPDLSEPDRYLFFPSREFLSTSAHSLGELASLWLDLLFETSQPSLPFLSLKAADVEAARRFTSALGQNGARPIVTINFGVGENRLKRASDDFEKRIVRLLIREGMRVVLDRGAGPGEARRFEAILADCAATARVVELDEERARGVTEVMDAVAGADILTWSGRIGILAAFISESDLYIGYDSAGQHIAAAAAVPSIDVFAGFSSRRMLDRWRPAGRAESSVVVVESAGEQSISVAAVVLDHARKMIERIRPHKRQEPA
jgi:ADP-heptose:LPS heptosyltransferase